MNAKKVGSFIKEQRQELGLSQKELAEKLYITDKAVSKWETGRGLPDISSLEPLSNALNVSVSEILNGEKSQNNESEIDNAKLLKKLKIKKYIRLAAEIVITIVYAYWLYIFKDTFKGFQNVLDLALHKNEIELLSVFTLIFIFLFVLWLIVEIITTIINKKGSVIKAVIICLSVCFVIGASLKMADMENSRSIELYDEPIKTVSYINYDDFFNDKFTTQIRINDTNEYITKIMLQCLTELTAKTICCTQNALPLQKPILQRLIITRRKNITKTRINITLAQAIIAKRQILTKDFMF